MGMGSEGVITFYVYGALALIVIYLVSFAVWFMVLRKKFLLRPVGSIFASLALSVLTLIIVAVILSIFLASVFS